MHLKYRKQGDTITIGAHCLACAKWLKQDIPLEGLKGMLVSLGVRDCEGEIVVPGSYVACELRILTPVNRDDDGGPIFQVVCEGPKQLDPLEVVGLLEGTNGTA